MITGMKTKGTICRTIKLGIVLLGLLFVMTPMTGEAATIDFNTVVNSLKVKFPQGKYWNHVGTAYDNVDGYTASPCTLHKTEGIHVQGTGGCTCNHFVNAKHGGKSTQCMGFAYKLGYDVFGDTTWTTSTVNPVANIRIGDVIRIGGYHSVFVIARNGNVVTVGEANYTGPCQISWNRTINLSTANISYYERADNYDAVMGTAASPVPANPDTATTDTPSTEAAATQTPTTQASVTQTAAPYTGWQKAADGVHYQYLQNGKTLKKKWITIGKKKYYLDKNGYRVTGLVKIGSKRYYFNTKGVMQKKKWVSSNGEDYYVASNGAVLKSQWLYKNNVLVYVTGDGSVAKSELVKIGRNTYYFNSKGKRSKGFKKCNGKYYYCNSKGIIQKKKWITKNGKTYYVQSNGVRAQNKLVKIGKYKYYFNSNGYLLKKQNITYNGKIYRADKKGRCKQTGKVAAAKNANP